MRLPINLNSSYIFRYSGHSVVFSQRYNSPHQCCRPNPIGDPKVKKKKKVNLLVFQTFQSEINLQLTSKQGSTINDNDPTL